MKHKGPPNEEWYGDYKGTNKQRQADWLRRLKIARSNTMKIIAATRKPVDKKEE